MIDLFREEGSPDHTLGKGEAESSNLSGSTRKFSILSKV